MSMLLEIKDFYTFGAYGGSDEARRRKVQPRDQHVKRGAFFFSLLFFFQFYLILFLHKAQPFFYFLRVLRENQMFQYLCFPIVSIIVISFLSISSLHFICCTQIIPIPFKFFFSRHVEVPRLSTSLSQESWTYIKCLSQKQFWCLSNRRTIM